MALIVTITGSPTAPSRADAVVDHVARRAAVRGHQVEAIALRDLPAEPLLRGDTSAPEIADALRALEQADAVVVGTPVFRASFSGLLKAFLDLLPRDALSGKAVLPLVTGGSMAHALVGDYALAPVLRSLRPAYVGGGRFVLADKVRLHEGGGAVLAPEVLAALGAVASSFVARLEGRPEPAVAPADARPAEVTARVVPVGDPVLRPLLEELQVEYGTRYARDSVNERLVEVPVTDFDAPHGAFVVLERGGVVVAGGAIRRRGPGVAEVKRMWTAHHARRQGLGRRVLHELEQQARRLGYHRIFLTTGPRQPEARALYLAAGYAPQFDLHADPEQIGHLAFEKPLVTSVQTLAS